MVFINESLVLSLTDRADRPDCLSFNLIAIICAHLSFDYVQTSEKYVVQVGDC